VKKIKSFAKINLFLKVTKRFKNFHKIHSLIVQINLYDEVLIKENIRNKNTILFFGKYKANKQNNTVINLLKLMKKKFSSIKYKNFDIHIKKNIPNGSGLGGASSNAATVFNFIKRKYKLKISDKDSQKLLAKIGKDCPLFLNQKAKLIKSTGEQFVEYKDNPKLNMLLIYPNMTLSTKKVFNKLKNISNISLKKGINFKDEKRLLDVCKYYGNDLLIPAIKIAPKLKTLIKLISKIEDSNFYSMTGSGSAFFLIFNKKKSLLNAQKIIKKHRVGFWTKIVKTI
tara:strand:- start:1414 stop:2265 length:852 start_codon:yes stop_codon:yes gene_type:complete